MSSAAMPSRRSYRENLVFVLLAGVLLEVVRWDVVSSPLWHLLESCTALGILVVAGWRRAHKATSAPHEEADDTAVTAAPHSKWEWSIALTLLLGPLLLELCGRLTGRFGQSAEYLLMNEMRNLAWLLAWDVRRPRVWRASSPLALFLVLGCFASIQNAIGWILAAVFAAVGMLRLASHGWERLHGTFAVTTHRDSMHRDAPRGTVVGSALTCVALVLVTCLGLMGKRATVSLAGFLPTSGGTRWHDHFAAGGIGDGDQLVSATEQASGFGPVESDLFLESRQPSLYDVANDLYGPPHKSEQTERMIALSSNVKIQMNHRRKSRMERATREFSAVRGQRSTTPSPRERHSDALIFVGGRTPLHLRVETFDHFDGQVWSRSDEDEPQPQCVMEQDNGKPWLRLHPGSAAPIAGPEESHLVKVIRLDSARIPTPAYPVGLHIDRVEDASFLEWTLDGALQLVGRERVPPLQVLHLKSRALERSQGNYDTARIPENVSRKYLPSDEPPSSRIVELAHRWAGNLPRGWPQLAELERRLRTEYRLDQAIQVDPAGGSAVEQFLFDLQGGPDYLFASATVLLARALGYPARCVMGLYASPDRYDRQSKLTPVFPQDLHLWAEVCAARNTWVTLDATPGYQVLEPPRSWWRRAADAVVAFARWLRDRPVLLGLCLVIVAVGYAIRPTLADLWFLAVWRVSVWWQPQNYVLATMQLLERRAALAGRPRPSSTTWARHFAPLLDQPTLESALLREVVELAQRELYSSRATMPPHDSARDRSHQRHRLCCATVVREWTTGAIQQALLPPRSDFVLMPLTGDRSS